MTEKSTSARKGKSEGALITEATLGFIGYRLRRAQLSVFQTFLSAFDSLGLRPAEYSVLVLIDENPGRKQTEIAATLDIKRANFVVLIDGLEKRGLVERASVATDKRANALFLTADGHAFLIKARTLHDELEADLVSRLGGVEQRGQLFALLDRLT